MSMRCGDKPSFFDRCLNVTYIKRDEGFESDGSDHSDSANAALALAANSGSSNSVEEKIIKDHAVFVREDGIQSHSAIVALPMWLLNNLFSGI